MDENNYREIHHRYVWHTLWTMIYERDVFNDVIILTFVSLHTAWCILRGLEHYIEDQPWFMWCYVLCIAMNTFSIVRTTRNLIRNRKKLVLEKELLKESEEIMLEAVKEKNNAMLQR